MDNAGYRQDPEKGTELSLVENSTAAKGPLNQDLNKSNKFGSKFGKHHKKDNNNSNADDDAGQNTAPSYSGGAGASGGSGGSGGQQQDSGQSTSCRPEVCQRARERYTAPDLRGSPWHRSKTIFLLVTIVALIVWAIIYSTLSKLDIL